MSKITESDVEQKQLWAFLTHPDFLAIPSEQIATKRFIPRRDIGKGASAVRGFAPDYLIYSDRLPVAVVEAKSPDESVEQGYAEARLYANELNASFATGTNPVTWVLATNGKDLLFGPVDSAPTVSCDFTTLVPSEPFAKITVNAGWPALRTISAPIASGLERKRYFNASYIFGGAQRLNVRLGQNSLSDVLAPIIRRYFDADSPEEKDEILEKAYIDSDLTTRYARVFETFLRDRIISGSIPAATVIEPHRKSEEHFSAALGEYTTRLPASGSLQLLIGAVGAGKTTFIERFEKFLLPSEVKERVFWVYINFNDAPPDPKQYAKWLCERFVEAFKKKYFRGDPAIQLAVFADKKRDFEFANFLIKDADPHEYNRRLSVELSDWQRDAITFATSACRYLIGDKHTGVVCILDNTDRRTRDQQLEIFELAQWFKSETRSCCVMALRDETYERFKNEPPLDSFINSNHFYIRAPRFIDVVRKRLQLSLDALRAGRLSASISGVGRVEISREKVSIFLSALFKQLFTSSKRKIAWVAEGLAGKSARTALRMFARLIYSPHIDERYLIQAGQSGGEWLIPDWAIANALMKTDYLFFAEDHGFVSNVFDFSDDTETSDNFIRLEILQYLVDQRKMLGDIGIQGYFFSSTICDRLSHLGYGRRDVLRELTWAVKRGLLIADHFSDRPIVETDAVKAHAGAFVHTNILLNRVEYIANCLLTAKLFDRSVAERVSEVWNIKLPQTDITLERKRELARLARDYLDVTYQQRCRNFPMGVELSLAGKTLERALDKALSIRGIDNEDLFGDEIDG